jgi:hypothetical protein
MKIVYNLTLNIVDKDYLKKKIILKLFMII